MQSSCLLCISTLLESGNRKCPQRAPLPTHQPATDTNLDFADYSRMFELRDQTTGEPLFETIQISLYACHHWHRHLTPLLTSGVFAGFARIACAQTILRLALIS